MNILFIGDIFGGPGRKIVREHIGHLMETHKAELVVMNAENSAGGFGVTPAIADELFAMGADVLTTGNHVWDKREIVEYWKATEGDSTSPARRILRPANYPAGSPGTGWYEGVTRSGVPYAVINVQGRVFMHSNDDPFRVVSEILTKTKAKVILVDMHAEATSEKMAMGWYLDGRVTAVLGTHTHVPTADERVLPNGTAYQTDVGMSGPYDSIIGVEKELVLQRFLTNMPNKFEAAKGDPRLCGVVISCDAETGKASSIKRLMLGQ
ncbi:MAG: TIGR00282 family metallophosphoesterase [Acidobacteriales bacterium]|nr:TIGR00282 family metallophosphoesterase [Terriglobales bacterium]